MPSAVTILTLALGLLPVQPPDTPPEILSGGSGVGRALLIGCSDYETFDQDLLGPANDVQLFAELLRKHFGFEERNVMRLAGWPDNPAARPTAENIAAAFERLIAATESGDRIVILLAGHGTRLPIPAAQIDPLDPANPEPDGFDEAFLPADYRPATEENIASGDVPASRAGRALRDDEFGRWLDRLEARGAHVWILFDCCHSGTMTRSADSRERTRGIPAAAAGPSSAALQAAAAKVERLRDAAPESAGAMPTAGESSATGAAAGGVSGEQAGLAGAGMSRAEGGGSVVAFYAAQAFETAPETRIPFDAPDLPDNYHGVFTHTLCTVLSGGGVTTYRGLGRRLLAQYRADRGSHGPTPFFAGPLDRAVLETGAPADPPAPQLTQRGGVWWVEGGALSGLRAGSILAVRADGAGPEAPPHAFVKVTAAGPTESEVVPTGHDGVAPVSADALPEGGRCEVIVRDFGDARVGLSLLPHGGADAAAVAAAAAVGLDRLPPEVGELVRRADSSDPGDWLLHPVTPAEASVLYGLSLDRPATLLLHEAKVSGEGDGSAGANVPAEEDDRFGHDARTPTVFAQYVAEDPEEFARVLERDLRRIYTWENTWRVAASYSAAGEPAVRLTVSDPARPDEPLPDGRPLMVGRIAQMTLANDDLRPRWVTALNLQPDYTISSWFTVAVEPGDELGPFQFEVVGETGGPEGILVFSAPVETRRSRLDLSYLEQEGFGGAERERSIRSAGPAADPLDRLLQAAASGGRMRAALRLDTARPEAVAWTFITVLPPQRPAASPAAESKTEAP